MTQVDAAFVCPFCGRRAGRDRAECARCGSTPIVPVEARDAYETILPMCGPSLSTTTDDTSSIS